VIYDQKELVKYPILQQITRNNILKDAETQIKAIPVITGPTASGKSAIAFALAQEFGWDIFSCDSRQVYRGMNIGTAKPSVSEQASVRHWLIDLIEPSESYSVFRFFDDANAAIKRCQGDGRQGIVCGGTGMYLRALIDGAGVQEESDPQVRDMLTERAKNEGCEVLHRELHQCDPQSALRIHAHDAQRIIRALAVYHQTGKPLSELHRITQIKSEFRFSVAKLCVDRDILYRRINDRVDMMIKQGLYDEFRGLAARGYNCMTPGMLCVGYREFFAVDNGECSFSDAVELIKRNTRRFAKRQITWFAHQQPGFEIDVSESPEKIIDRLKTFFRDSAFC